jgi:hypothetical protein
MQKTEGIIPALRTPNKMTTKLRALFMALTLLSGCASQYTLDELAKDQRACATGDQRACQWIPYDQEGVRQSKERNTDTAVGVAAVLLLFPLIILGAAAAAKQPSYVVVAKCRGWAC